MKEKLRMEPLPRDGLGRLVMARWVLLAIETLAVLVLARALAVGLPTQSMVAVLVLHLLLILVAARRLRVAERCAPGEIAAGLAADAAVVATLVYFSGGYANPFISLLLVPLILCAVSLPAVFAWLMTAWVALLYSLLAEFYLPLSLTMNEQAAINLHLAGMWLDFLLTAVLVAAFVTRLAAALRRREADLARIREQALRDEQLFALGMQAAAAAHDLATPLSTLRLSLNELQRDYAGDDELAPGLAAMAAQSERMKDVLDRLAAAAGAARAAETLERPLDEWLTEIFEHWRLMRPDADAELRLTGTQPAPRVREEPTLISVLSTLLNNAADASPGWLRLEADWDTAELNVRVLDRGPGLVNSENKPDGWGVGLSLARAALERLGGRIDLESHPGEETAARLHLPLAGLGTS